jgi:hypothetical protein
MSLPIDSSSRRVAPPPPPKPKVKAPATHVHHHAETRTTRHGSVSKHSKNPLPDVPSPHGPAIRRDTHFETGGSTGSASVQGPSFHVDGSAGGSISASGIDAHVDVDLSGTAVTAEAEGKKTINFSVAGEKYSVTLDLKAMGEIGADAHLHLDVHLGTGGVKVSASAEGFAGAKASLTGSIELSHEGDELASGQVTVGADVGVAGSAHADVGFSGGKVSFDVGAEGSIGAGLSLDVQGDVNVPNVLEAVVETGEAAIKQGAKELVEDGKELIENGVGELKDLADKGVDEAKDLAVDFAHDLDDLAQQGIDAAEDLVGDVGDTLKDVGGAAVKGLESFGHEVLHDLNPTNWF